MKRRYLNKMNVSKSHLMLSRIQYLENISLKMFLIIMTLMMTTHGGRLLRYNGCECGIENPPEKDFFHDVGKLIKYLTSYISIIHLSNL